MLSSINKENGLTLVCGGQTALVGLVVDIWAPTGELTTKVRWARVK